MTIAQDIHDIEDARCARAWRICYHKRTETVILQLHKRCPSPENEVLAFAYMNAEEAYELAQKLLSVYDKVTQTST